MQGVQSRLRELLERAVDWPEAAQEELVELGLAIEASQTSNYSASPDELAAIDAAAAEVKQGHLASPADVDAVLRRFRRQ